MLLMQNGSFTDSVRQVREAAIVDAQMERTERDLFEILWSQVLSLR